MTGAGRIPRWPDRTGTPMAIRCDTPTSSRPSSTRRPSSSGWLNTARPAGEKSRSTCITASLRPIRAGKHAQGSCRVQRHPRRSRLPVDLERTGSPALCVRPRELGPGEFLRRALLRGRRGDADPRGDRLLRRLHPSLGAGPGPDCEDQQHIRVRTPSRSAGSPSPAGEIFGGGGRPDISPHRPGTSGHSGDPTAGRWPSPRIENGELTGARPPTMDRLRLWRQAAISVQGRPNWVFIKLHCHGMDPRDTRALLGHPMQQFLKALTEDARDATATSSTSSRRAR